MSEYTQEHIQQVTSYFETIEGDYWKTVDEISRDTRVNAATVFAMLASSGEFVRSSYRTKGGEPLFTTRKLFRNRAPFVDKMIGAFKNRID